jgi:Ca2+-binding RTX toxin-like protein
LPQVHELAREQYLLELINRARMNPSGEVARYGVSLNQGLSAGTINSTPKQVLAGNINLAKSADNHSAFMLSHDQFAHSAIGDGDPGSRMAAAGYVFTGNWTWGENIAWSGTTGSASTAFYDMQVDVEHGGLVKSSGHRVNILNGAFKEVGLGTLSGSFDGHNALMTTENFATSGSGSFVTGVAYRDNVKADNFYSIGEGFSGLSVKLYNGSGSLLKSGTTASAGGYGLKTTATGTVECVFSGAALTGTIGAKFKMGSSNVKVDLVDGDDIEANVTVTLTRDASGLRLIGIQGICGYGNAANNVMFGNSGGNVLKGLAGADTINGGNGNDFLVGGIGADSLTGGYGNDHFRYFAATEGGDTIVAFGSNDLIEFKSSGFGGLAVGQVAAAIFVSRAADNAAQDAGDRFIYQRDTDTLWYDSDGTGAEAAVKIATLSNDFSLAAADLLIV